MYVNFPTIGRFIDRKKISGYLELVGYTVKGYVVLFGVMKMF